MAKRQRAELADEKKSSYFTSDKPNIEFVPSGCALLDCVLGGGYPIGRMVNIVGDKSTSKTALATEAITNFKRKWPDGFAAYRDAEAAFDQDYAKAMGMPVDDVDFGDEDQPLITVEAFIKDFNGFLDRCKKADVRGIYVLDSIDSLSDEGEMDRETGEKTYGMAKAKLLSEFFRKTTSKTERAKVLLLIVSQVRENIDRVSFGEKYKRAGGKALDFYASQCLWLANIEILKKEIKKVKRPYGVVVRGKAKKNKVGLALREADFRFRFGYGVEDVESSIEWLKEVNRLKEAGLAPNDVKEYLAQLEGMKFADYESERVTITKAVKKVWAEIESDFLPSRGKYRA